MSEEYMNKERLIETINYYLLSPGNAKLDDDWCERARVTDGQIAWAKFEEEYELIPKPKYKIGQKVRQFDGKEYEIVARVWSDVMQHWYYSSQSFFHKYSHREVDVKEVIDEL